MYNQCMVKTRIAPSPTGFLHLGTLYQALLDKAFAIRNNGKFIVRIEDTDTNRYVEGAVDALYKGLKWVNISFDETYIQSERLDIYKKHADELIEKGHAYYCFCTEERLTKLREEQSKKKVPPMYDKHCRSINIDEAKKRVDAGEKFVIRMKIPENTKILVHDLIRGDIEFDSSAVDDQVIMKGNGFPTYHLAAMVDDHLMEITHVLRGPEWITSFPKHKLLYDYFDWEMPVFVHTPLITDMSGAKLSKRKGHSSVDWFRRKGYLPEAVLNFISLLGWSHPEGKEIFSFDEFSKVFDFKDLSAVSPKFDLVKMEWMNGQYLQNLSDEEFINRLTSWLKYCISSEYQGATEFETHWTPNDYKLMLNFLNSLNDETKLLFAEINNQRIKKFEDLLPLNNFFVKDTEINQELLTKNKSKEEIKSHMNWFLSELENLGDWNLESLKGLEEKTVKRASELGWKVGEVFHPIRVLLAGSTISPPLFESIFIFGKEKTIKSLNR